LDVVIGIYGEFLFEEYNICLRRNNYGGYNKEGKKEL